MPCKCCLRIRKCYLHLFIFFLYFSNILFIVGFDAAFCLRRKREWRRKRHQLQNGKIQEMRVAIVFTRQRFFTSRFITSHPLFLASSRSGRELYPLKRQRRSHLSVARKESQSRVPARREPSSCFHAPYHYLS